MEAIQERRITAGVPGAFEGPGMPGGWSFPLSRFIFDHLLVRPRRVKRCSQKSLSIGTFCRWRSGYKNDRVTHAPLQP